MHENETFWSSSPFCRRAVRRRLRTARLHPLPLARLSGVGGAALERKQRLLAHLVVLPQVRQVDTPPFSSGEELSHARQLLIVRKHSELDKLAGRAK